MIRAPSRDRCGAATGQSCAGLLRIRPGSSPKGSLPVAAGTVQPAGDTQISGRILRSR